MLAAAFKAEAASFLAQFGVERLPDGRINISKGKYTTCNLKHPHFEFRYSKAQLIPKITE